MNGATQLAVGLVSSTTVTVVVQVEELPDASVTVKVTSFSPNIVQSKSVTSILTESTSQLSVEPSLISVSEICAFPLASNEIENGSTQLAVGLVSSTTVTVVVQVEELPAASVTVNSTWFAPIIVQSKSVMSIAVVSIPQLSVEPLFISAAVIDAFPVASRAIVNGDTQLAIGFVLSSTVTVAVQLSLFPLVSVTVSVTVFAPNMEQSKVELSIS